MSEPVPPNTLLTIAGHDPTGGAGLTSDIFTFGQLGFHGLSVLTAATVQTPTQVLSTVPLHAELITQQLTTLLKVITPLGVKTGLIGAEETIRGIGPYLLQLKQAGIPVIVDPILKSGDDQFSFWDSTKIRAALAQLCQCATLLTPNVPEAEVLSEVSITSPEEGRHSVRSIARKHRCSVLLKGGHGNFRGTDILACYTSEEEPIEEVIFSPLSPYTAGVHGTGCALSSAILAFLVRGSLDDSDEKRKKQPIKNMISAITKARLYLQKLALNSYPVGEGRLILRTPKNSDSDRG